MKSVELLNFEGSCVRSQIVLVDGKPQEILIREGNSSSKVFIDQLTFVFDIDDFLNCALRQCFDKKNFAEELGYYNALVAELFIFLSAVFGFKSYQKRDRGLNLYEHSYLIGVQGTSVNYGTICIGGNRNTCCVVLTGMGLSVASDGWEKRLYDFAQLLGSSFRLSRIDITRDFFNGEYTVDDAERDYLNDGYTLSSIRPLCDKQGYDWFNNTKLGRTFYIGSRKNSSRLVRVYEKGKQLGDVDSEWVRVEVSYRSRDLILSIDMLLHPTLYVSEYPAISKALNCVNDSVKRIDIKRKSLCIIYDRASRFYRNQCGRWINFLVGIGKTADEIVAMMTKHLHFKDVPKRLDPRCYDLLPADFY